MNADDTNGISRLSSTGFRHILPIVSTHFRLRFQFLFTRNRRSNYYLMQCIKHKCLIRQKREIKRKKGREGREDGREGRVPLINNSIAKHKLSNINYVLQMWSDSDFFYRA